MMSLTTPQAENPAKQDSILLQMPVLRDFIDKILTRAIMRYDNYLARQLRKWQETVWCVNIFSGGYHYGKEEPNRSRSKENGCSTG